MYDLRHTADTVGSTFACNPNCSPCIVCSLVTVVLAGQTDAWSTCTQTSGSVETYQKTNVWIALGTLIAIPAQSGRHVCCSFSMLIIVLSIASS